jgi:ferredoxin-thioredoxin reductase catalytic subunit
LDAEKLRQVSKRYAKSQGFEINPDEKTVNLIIQGLLHNEAKFGYRYCPCRAVTGYKEQDRKIICPCIYHKDEIKSMGHCRCALFVAKKSSAF